MGEYSDADIVPHWLRDWQALLFDNGWMIPGYPPELGGRNCTPVQTLIYLETMASRRVPRSGHFPGYAIVTPSLLEFGNEEQRALAPAAARGDTIWCIGMSEPNAGSDLAGLQTRADVFDDHFVVNGQKVWTSYATIAQKCFCYVRTDPDAAQAQGHLVADHRYGHARDRRAATHPHQPEGRLCRGVLHSMSSCHARTSSANGIMDGRSRRAPSRTNAAVFLGRERRTLRADREGLVALVRITGASSDPATRRYIVQTYELAVSSRVCWLARALNPSVELECPG